MSDAGWEELVGQAPTDISSLLYHFLQARAENSIRVKVLRKRKGEVSSEIQRFY